MTKKQLISPLETEGCHISVLETFQTSEGKTCLKHELQL